MRLLKMLWYGMFIDYHLKKINQFNKKRKTVRKFHYDMALYYYKKAYGEEYHKSE